MGNVSSFLKLIRFERALSAPFGVIFTGIATGDLVTLQWEYVVACLAVFFGAVANFGLNDYVDVDADKKNERVDRPLAGNRFKPRTAMITAVASVAIALSLSLFLNPVARGLMLAGLPASLFYNLGLKKYVLLKNAFIGFANIGVTLVGSLVSDAVLEPMAFYIAAIGFFFSLSYEGMLDIADMKGDREQGVDTLPSRFGVRNTVRFSLLFGLGAVIADPLPFFLEIDPRLKGDCLFLILILIPVANRLLISRSLINDQSKENIFRLKKRVFRNLLFGCLCYLIGFLI